VESRRPERDVVQAAEITDQSLVLPCKLTELPRSAERWRRHFGL
jgi:hypothetical protein